MTLCIATGQRAQITPGESIAFGSKAIPLDAQSRAPIQFPTKDDISYTPLIDFLKPTPRPEVKDQVVIIGLDTDNVSRVQTPIGPLKPHRAFYYALVSLLQRVE